MKTLSAFLIMVLGWSVIVATFLTEESRGAGVNEVSANNFFGVGGRGVGMSEAVVVSVDDGTAIVYNPAGLVRLKRPELFAGLSHEKVGNRTTWTTAVAANDFSKTRLNSLNLTVPVPTYRGALVVAFGVNRTKSFDRTFTFDTQLPDPDRSQAIEEGSGGIREWSAAGAIELSPRLALGTTLTYYHGEENYFWDFSYPDTAYGGRGRKTDTRDDLYSAVGIRVGMTYDLNPYLTLGFTIDAPTRYIIKQDYLEHTVTAGEVGDTVGTYEYDLVHPFIFNSGVAFRIKTLLLEADVGYADWSQLEYKDAPDLDNRSLQLAYSDVVQFRLGGEYVVPQYGIALRAGFKHDPLPFSGRQITSQVEKDRNSFSFGAGFLIDRVAMLDIAYARATYKIYDGRNKLSQKYTSDKVIVSIGYRI